MLDEGDHMQTKIEGNGNKNRKTATATATRYLVEDFCFAACDLAAIGYGTDRSDDVIAHIYPDGVVVGHISRD